MIEMPKHKSLQSWFIMDTKTKKLYGTNSLKGFTEAAASKRSTIYNAATGGKARFKTMEVRSCGVIENAD